jgi:hypothetical protein
LAQSACWRQQLQQQGADGMPATAKRPGCDAADSLPALGVLDKRGVCYNTHTVCPDMNIWPVNLCEGKLRLHPIPHQHKVCRAIPAMVHIGTDLTVYVPRLHHMAGLRPSYRYFSFPKTPLKLALSNHAEAPNAETTEQCSCAFNTEKHTFVAGCEKLSTVLCASVGNADVRWPAESRFLPRVLPDHCCCGCSPSGDTSSMPS